MAQVVLASHVNAVGASQHELPTQLHVSWFTIVHVCKVIKILRGRRVQHAISKAPRHKHSFHRLCEDKAASSRRLADPFLAVA